MEYITCNKGGRKLAFENNIYIKQKVLSNGTVWGDIMGGFCPGGFCPRGDFVQGDFVRGILSGGFCPGGFCPRTIQFDGVILYKDCILIPVSLRQHMLAILHSAHQGISSMTARAESSVFWPGITPAITAL